VAYFRVVDPIKAVVNLQNYTFAVSQQAQTSLRSITGQSKMDQLLSERESVNRELRRVIDEPTGGAVGGSGSSGWISRTSRCPRDRDWLDYDDQAAADPAGPVTFSDAHIFLQGQLSAVTVLSCRHYQVASFPHAGMAGTIGSRHCPLDQLSLARVPAIDPYLAGYTAFLQRMACRRRGRTT
jgi:SPFH domain/Band 7 family protein